MNELMEHFGQWGAVIFFIIVYGIAILFIPFNKKIERKPAYAYLGFVIAFAIEMHGIPFSMMLIASLVGRALPEGVLWGHTLIDYVGYTGLYLNIGLALLGMILIIFGWYQIYHGYWKKVDGSGQIVSDGLYTYIRHPQYTGLILIALGMVLGWATLTNLVMLPIIIFMYYRLSLKEEKQMIEEFGDAYIIYMKHTKRFIPWII